MKVYRGLESFKKIKQAFVTQGTFDGVHAAHQVILKKLHSMALEGGGETVVITFEPHPRVVLFPEDHGLQILSTLDEKISLLEQQGVHHLLILPFTRSFSRLNSLEFIRDILVERIGTKCLVIGYNHRFGKNREGSFEHLKEYGPAYGFEIREIPEQDVDEVSVSSTRIREALVNGDVAKASRFLGRFYSLTGTVIKGLMLGRKLGYPTANLICNHPLKLIPADGVYAVWVKTPFGKKGGMLNIGNNPTIAGKGRSIEVNIFDLDEDLYSQTLEIEFVERMRDEIKFADFDSLKNQLFEDKLMAQRILNAEGGNSRK